MSDWVRLDRATLNTPLKQVVQGAIVELLPSPYDVPGAVRPYYNSLHHRFGVQFQYIADDEPKIEIASEHDADVKVVLGRNSWRVYSIEVPAESNQIEDNPLVVGLMQGALTSLAKKRESRSSHYNLLADGVIDKNKSQVFGAVAMEGQAAT